MIKFILNTLMMIVLLNQPLYASNSKTTFAQDTTIKLLVKDSLADKISMIDSTNKDSLQNSKLYYGTASFYSINLEGSETSNQETFRHSKMTAASNRFKLNTWLRVTNLSNDKSIIVRVNDRMHPRMDAKGRIVDLSYTGAQKLGFVSKGITKVKVQVVAKGTKI